MLNSKVGLDLAWSGANLEARRDSYRILMEGKFRKRPGGKVVDVINCVLWSISPEQMFLSFHRKKCSFQKRILKC